jgi:hypothetical protein
VTVGTIVGRGVEVGGGLGVRVAVALDVLEGVSVALDVEDGEGDGDAVIVTLLVALGVADGVRDGTGVALAGGVRVADGSRATTVGVCVNVGVPEGWRMGVWLGVRDGAIVGVACGIVRLHASAKSAPNANHSAAPRRMVNPPVRWN